MTGFFEGHSDELVLAPFHRWAPRVAEMHLLDLPGEEDQLKASRDRLKRDAREFARGTVSRENPHAGSRLRKEINELIGAEFRRKWVPLLALQSEMLRRSARSAEELDPDEALAVLTEASSAV